MDIRTACGSGDRRSASSRGDEAPVADRRGGQESSPMTLPPTRPALPACTAARPVGRARSLAPSLRRLRTAPAGAGRRPKARRLAQGSRDAAGPTGTSAPTYSAPKLRCQGGGARIPGVRGSVGAVHGGRIRVATPAGRALRRAAPAIGGPARRGPPRVASGDRRPARGGRGSPARLRRAWRWQRIWRACGPPLAWPPRCAPTVSSAPTSPGAPWPGTPG